MTQNEIFIVLQTLWDFFLIVLACGISAYWIAFWLLLFDKAPLNPERTDLFAKGILFFRNLRGKTND